LDTTRTRLRRTLWTSLGAGTAALVLAGAAWAHAEISPAIFQAGEGREFVLAVPTESADATTTSVELTPPAGFQVFGFAAVPGWRRTVDQTGEGEDATITKVTWSGGSVPEGEYARFPFTGNGDDVETYAFEIRQTYSDGSIVDWSGPEDSDEPAARVTAIEELGGGGGDGGSNTLSIIALVIGGLGLVAGVAALLAGGKRSLA
jgi:uncharacterized protein YcnI